MYDSEYFKKVIGDNYNQKEIYNTQKNEQENNIFPVNATSQKPRDEANRNISYNNSPYPEDFNVANYQNTNTYPVNNNQANNNPVNNNPVNNNPEYLRSNNMQNYNNVQLANNNVVNAQYQGVQNTNAQYQEVQNNSAQYQEIQNTNAGYQERENTSTEYPEIYNVVNPMVEEALSKNQDMEYTNSVIDTMARNIYNALEVDVNPMNNTREVNSNGIYRNTDIVEANARPRNSLLFDLIRILILNNINRPRPTMPHPDRPTPYPPCPRY